MSLAATGDILANTETSPFIATPSAWLPSTTSGQMVGDYTSATTSGGKIHAIFATANAPVGSTFDEAMQTNASGLPDLADDGVTFTSKHDKPVANAHSDHPRLTTPVVGQ